jgi:hypothetical protein
MVVWRVLELVAALALTFLIGAISGPFGIAEFLVIFAISLTLCILAGPRTRS